MSISRLLFGLLLSGASASALACSHPALPGIPADGRISGRIERTIKADMIRYVTEMSAYVACVEASHSAAVGEGAPGQHVSLLATRHNAAVAELEAVRDIYVDTVGPLEELFFEQPFDSGNRRSDAAPRLAPVPRGPDAVLRRLERLRGGASCADEAVCSKAFTEPGAEN